MPLRIKQQAAAITLVTERERVEVRRDRFRLDLDRLAAPGADAPLEAALEGAPCQETIWMAWA